MKCDELEEEYLWTNNVKTPSTIMVRVYNADEVDAAIAELKRKLDDKDKYITRLEALRKVHVEAITSMETRRHQDDKKIRMLYRALCRLRIGFAKHFGRVNSGKKIVAYWKAKADKFKETK